MQRDYIGYILALICLIIATLVSWHFYEKSRQFKGPALVLDFFPSNIYDAAKESRMPIKVLKSDGSNLKKSVHVARHVFWNYGNQPIEAGDVLSPIKVSMSMGAEILSVSASEASREVVRCEVKQENSHDFLINFRILEHGDGCAIKVFYSGDQYPKYYISGDIINVKKIEVASETLNDRIRIHEKRRKFNVVPYLNEAPAIIGFIAFVIVFIFYMRTKGLPKKKFYPLTVVCIMLVGLVIYLSEVVVTSITSITFDMSTAAPDTSTWVSLEEWPLGEWPLLTDDELRKSNSQE